MKDKKIRNEDINLDEISLENTLESFDSSILDNQTTNQTLEEQREIEYVSILEENIPKSVDAVPVVDLIEGMTFDHTKKTKITRKERKAQKKEIKHRMMRESVSESTTFKYKKNKFKKPEQFIKFLNEQYLDIDEIGTNLLQSEAFYGWLKKYGKNYDISLKSWENKVRNLEDASISQSDKIEEKGSKMTKM